MAMSETEILYNCTLNQFLEEVDYQLNLLMQMYPHEKRGKIVCWSCLKAEISLLKAHREKLLETRDTQDDWLETVQPLCGKITDKLNRKNIKEARYRVEMPLLAKEVCCAD